MAFSSGEEITCMLQRWGQGDEHALDSLTPLVYDDLRHIASYILKGERPGHTLQPTALVNEAYLKLAGAAKIQLQDRKHFFAVAARAMRQILVDYARSRGREKRGGAMAFLPLDEALAMAPEQLSHDVLALDEALNRLAAKDPRKTRIVELRFFGGLSNEETAEILQISPNTVMRHWSMAKAWLRREMDGRKDDEPTTVEES
ncbi:MAG TPA: sigma-70 family RNA polymerase sigma factor [Candidatus Angelobacter sp.]|nr:sigma-70 family RNA polymerase sigma factor [Candidatus Angelobacter sp.]